jgi:hypothetical protein
VNEQERKEREALEEGRVAKLIEELSPDAPSGEAGVDPEARALREVAGLLPYALAPRAPSAEVRRRLLAQVGGAGEADRAVPALVGARGEPSAAAGFRWALPLAAVLALALAGVVGWQELRHGEQRRVIAELERNLGATSLEGAELVEARALLARRSEQVAMLTERGAEICLLEPYGERPQFPRARATMVVAADRSHWFLRGERLDPCDQGRAYKIWFETETGSVPGPSFRVDGPDAGIEIAAEGLPEGLVTISITLEHDPDCETPEGPQVLRAGPPIRLL